MSTDYEKLGVFYLGREYDAASKQLAAEPILYDSKDLTTHAVCVGMTGSGKTGLCLAMLEEAAIDGIPAICIDPKGDIGNLLLNFPGLSAAEFAPWVDSAEAQRRNLSAEQYAAQVAEQWRAGLVEWNEPPERVAKLRDAADIAIYTPGSNAGLGLSVLRTLASPGKDALADSAALREQIGPIVAALLTLLGRDADPVKSRDYILLARIIENAWSQELALDLPALIAAIQKPAFDKLGAFDLETFYPAKDRTELAMAVNALLASPGFSAWLEGEPLDAQKLLFGANGKPRISIISVAHLSDAERMFIVTLVLNELVAWMRRQSGTSSLRAILYMDEIFGYFPPTANPPSKPPMLTLLKQARAFGLGCVLATQNPVDLDYRGLGNTGTWLIGRLQTERDKLRVIEGLTSATAAGPALDRSLLDRLMASLAPRVFLLRNAKEDAPRLMKSRWALSYLRGPLTNAEISRLMTPLKAARAPAPTGAAAATTGAAAAMTGATSALAGTTAQAAAPRPAARPIVAAQVRELFLAATRGSGPIEYRPAVLGAAKLHFIDSTLGLDAWQTLSYCAPFSDDGREPQWTQSADATGVRAQAVAQPAAQASFADLPAAASRAESYAAWSKSLAAYLYESARADVLICDAFKLVSNPGESEGEFRARMAQTLREQRDASVEKLRATYAPKLAALQARLQRAQDRTEREHAQLNQRKISTAVSVGAAILGAFLGRKAISATSMGRAATAMRSAGRIGQEKQDVTNAEESAAAVEQQLKELQTQCDAELAALSAKLDPSAVALRAVKVSPRKSDIAVGEVALAWQPWRAGADGFPAPA